MSKRLLIVGAGGHARVIAGIVAHTDWEVCGVLDRAAPTTGERVGSYNVVGSFDDLDAWYARDVRHVVLAIGANRERAAMLDVVTNRGFVVVGMRHPSALVEHGAHVADDAILCIGCIVAAEATIGQNALLNSGCIVDHECRIGSHVHIGPGASLAGRVTVGTGTFVGMGSCVRERISIGEGALVGAGSVVVDDIPDFATVIGIPARVTPSIASHWVQQ